MNTLINLQTEFSFRKSIVKTDELLELAEKFNYNAISLANDNLTEAIAFNKKCLNKNIKPAIGLRINFMAGFNFDPNTYQIILYAKNDEGYKNLLKIEHSKKNNTITNKELTNYSKSIICVTNFLNNKGNFPHRIDKHINYFKNLFHSDFFMYTTNNPTQSRYNDLLLDIALNSHLLILTEDSVLFTKKTQYEAYKCFLKLNNIKEENFSNCYLRSEKEMKDSNDIFFEKIEELFATKEIVVSNCSDDIILKERVTNIYYQNHIKDNAEERLNKELSIIISKGFSTYFLIAADVISFCESNNILTGFGRGSSVASYVCYLLGITKINPLNHNLIFERFLNDERQDLPDIDIDVDANKKELIIKYLISKYGNKYVAQFSTYGKYSHLTAFKDIKDFLQITEQEALEIESMLKNNESIQEKYPNIFEILDPFDNMFKYSSINPAGIIVTKNELINYSNYYYKNNIPVMVLDKNSIEDLGLIKLDILSLKTLSTLETMLKQIKININDIPLNDTKTIKVINNQLTAGIFQLESRGIKQLLPYISNFEHLINTLALYRPAVLESNMHKEYINNFEEKPKYIHNDFTLFLSETNGIVLFQEQIILIISHYANYSFAKAERFRKNINDTNLQNEFINDVSGNGYDEYANSILRYLLKISKFSFNKSHSVAYAKLSYLMAYIKANYPDIFYTVLLNKNIEEKKDNAPLITELLRSNYKIIVPKYGIAVEKYTINNKTVNVGLLQLKNIGYKDVKIILGSKEPEDILSNKNLAKIAKNTLKNIGYFDNYESLTTVISEEEKIKFEVESMGFTSRLSTDNQGFIIETHKREKTITGKIYLNTGEITFVCFNSESFVDLTKGKLIMYEYTKNHTNLTDIIINKVIKSK